PYCSTCLRPDKHLLRCPMSWHESLHPGAIPAGRQRQAAEAEALRVNAELNPRQKIFDDLCASRCRQEVYRTPLLEADRRPLQPLFGLLLASQHSRRFCQDFSKLPGSTALLRAQRLFSTTLLAALDRADAHPNRLLKRSRTMDDDQVIHEAL